MLHMRSVFLVIGSSRPCRLPDDRRCFVRDSEVSGRLFLVLFWCF